MGFKGEVFLTKTVFLNLLFLKDLFLLTFSLDKNNIGCPLYLPGAKRRGERAG